MDFWNKARSFANEATKRTQDFTSEVSRLSDVVSFRADQLRSEAAKRAEELRSQAARRAEEVRRLATEITGAASTSETPATETRIPEKDLKAFGVTDELTEFVQGITPTTFRDFPLEDDTQLYGVDAVSNVSQDLSEWQERHAALVLSVVQEISKLRYELCPRFMKERKFWRIYFILMDRHVAPYEKRYMNAAKSKAGKQEKVVGEVKDVKLKDPENGASSSSTEVLETDRPSCIDQDLDAFLLGDPAESDDALDDNGGDFDEDFDKMLDGLDDDDEEEKGNN